MTCARAVAVALAAGIALCACGTPKPGTELVIDLVPGAAIAREAHDVAVHIDSGHAADRRLETMYDGVTDDPPPVRIAITPRGGDATRILSFVATARDATGASLATVRLRTGFVAGQIKHLILRFDDACRAVSCADDETCSEGACASSAVDAVSLPDYPADGGVPLLADAGIPPPRDAGSSPPPSDGGALDADASPSPDAGP